MWGSFGDITFQLLNTPEVVSIEEKAKYSTLAVFGQKERLHFTGFETKKVNFSFLLNIAFCSPSEEIKKLQKLKDEIKAENLIIGDENYGKFIIEGIKTEILKTTPNGQILSAKVEISLNEV
ncbi:phage tail protein [Persephonella sp.]